MCNAPKVQKTEKRTGAGGGYNEREGVEYKQRQESDDEFDEVDFNSFFSDLLINDF